MALVLSAAVLWSAPAVAQEGEQDATRVVQAGQSDESFQQVPAQSKVYFPDVITPESVAAARLRVAEQQQIAARKADEDAGSKLKQVSPEGADDDPIAQLGEGLDLPELAQLSEGERRVLLEAIEGTDICDDPPDVEAIRALCRNRLETRSGDFAARTVNALSAEERLLGEGLEDVTSPAIERVIERLARNVGKAETFEDQAVASVALGETASADAMATGTAGEPGSDLSPETQQLINALIQQLGANGGGS